MDPKTSKRGKHLAHVLMNVMRFITFINSYLDPPFPNSCISLWNYLWFQTAPDVSVVPKTCDALAGNYTFTAEFSNCKDGTLRMYSGVFDLEKKGSYNLVAYLDTTGSTAVGKLAMVRLLTQPSTSLWTILRKQRKNKCNQRL